MSLARHVQFQSNELAKGLYTLSCDLVRQRIAVGYRYDMGLVNIYIYCKELGLAYSSKFKSMYTHVNPTPCWTPLLLGPV